MKGKAIFELGNQVTRFDDYLYKITSQSGNGTYKIIGTEIGWTCSCPDHTVRGVKCKHVWAVEFSQAIRKEVRESIVINPLSSQVCPICGSDNVVKFGVRHNKNGSIQRLACKNCDKTFSENFGFEKLKATPQIVTSALQLYFTGESLRNVQKFLKLQGVDVSHQTVYNWIRKYVSLMEKYLEKIQPKLSGVWRADEIYIKIKGNMKYLFAMMDDETRFWIAQEVADRKEGHDARNLLRLSEKAGGKRPQTFITDGLPSYQEAYQKEWWRRPIAKRTKHIHAIKLQGSKNNNKMERLNGEIRDREKTMRGLKKVDTPILKGYQIYHNYLRPHEALNGKTPADMAGIQIEGDNKWITLIQNAVNVNQPR